MNSGFTDSTVWILDTLYMYLGIPQYGFWIQGFYCMNTEVRDFTVWIRYLGIALYGFWTTCICICILMYGFGIQGFYCMYSVFTDSTVCILYLQIILYEFDIQGF